jgi:hypothetical protein
MAQFLYERYNMWSITPKVGRAGGFAVKSEDLKENQ